MSNLFEAYNELAYYNGGGSLKSKNLRLLNTRTDAERTLYVFFSDDITREMQNTQIKGSAKYNVSDDKPAS